MIVIADYNPDWPAEFEAVRMDLAKTLGPLALQVDHIGSTSVPGLAAKDIIDVQITVAALIPEIVARLSACGYQHRAHITHDHVPAGENPAPGRWAKAFFYQPTARRRANVHARILGNPNQRYPLLFRDYLRTHPPAALSLGLIKREIAKRHADDEDSYYDIKDPVCDLIWAAAQEWAGGPENAAGFRSHPPPKHT
ncbi:MAG: uncharacterized protein JWM32_2073 [Verrucomicrobia bacterium]|nr:uncharacterized protein [Verrucomicrobiota bacterium]